MSVKFHLPGLRANFPINMLLVKMMQTYPEYFREGIEIGSFFGEFPTSKWNGGRFSGGDQCNAEYIRQVIKAVNAEGIPVRFTYTNPLITEEDLADPYCNFCLLEANNGMNEVIVVSPMLEEYIRECYPNFKITSSTCKEIRDIDGVNAELEKDYNLVVLDYNLNNQFDVLEQIKRKDKCELLVNACCVPNCPRRGEHYKFLAKQEATALKNRELPANKQKAIPSWYCEYGENTSLYVSKNYSTHISPEAIWEKYVPMGFNQFKLEGRTANLFLLIDTYAYYFAKPEYRDEMRFVLTTNLQSNKIITVNQPRKEVWP
ncbi:MAG: hypothetical protein IJZ55_02000 [Lachnospiraceae bacterium]|nr:hypothetical protein [Lachnospiraceae bacterium]